MKKRVILTRSVRSKIEKPDLFKQNKQIYGIIPKS